MVFWALERKKQREQENKAKNQAEVLAQLLADVSPESRQELEEWAREKGIPIDKAPPH